MDEHCTDEIEALKSVYAGADLPVLLLEGNGFDIVWKNKAASDLYPELEKSSDVGTVFGISDEDKCWELLSEGHCAEKLSIKALPANLNFIPIEGKNQVLVHISVAKNAVREGILRMNDALSHQIRAPLTVQFSAVQALRAHEEDNPEADEAASLIAQSAYHILRAESNYAEFCRMLIDEERYNMCKIDAAALCRELCRAVEFFSINLKTPFEHRVKKEYLYIKADPNKLTLCLLNLLLNAFKFSGENPRVSLELSATEAEIRILISDSGVGMPPEVLEHAFEPFFARTPETSQPLSMGLGLTIARRVAQKHGGSLALISVPGDGTAAMLTLPRDNSGEDPVTACENSVDMLANLFSPLYITMSDITSPPMLSIKKNWSI